VSGRTETHGIILLIWYDDKGDKNAIMRRGRHGEIPLEWGATEKNLGIQWGWGQFILLCHSV